MTAEVEQLKARRKAGSKEIVFGAVVPLSGPAAPWGIPMQKSWQMLVDQILTRPFCRGQEDFGNMIYHDAVMFLRHLPVPTAKARFHMNELDTQLPCGESAGEIRVGVPTHNDNRRL